MENAQIADMFDEIANLLELRDDNPIRIRSYRSAAQTVRSLSDRLQDLAEEGKDLSELSNIGDSTAGKTEKAVYKRLDMKWVPPELRIEYPIIN